MHGVPEIRHNFSLGIPEASRRRRLGARPLRSYDTISSEVRPGRARPPWRKGRRKTQREGRPLPRPRTGKPKRGQPQPRFGRRCLLKKRGVVSRRKRRGSGARRPAGRVPLSGHVGTCLQIVRTRHTTEHTNARNHPLPAPSRTGSGKSGRMYPHEAARADTAQKIRSPRRDRTTSIRRAAHPLHDKRNPESP